LISHVRLVNPTGDLVELATQDDIDAASKRHKVVRLNSSDRLIAYEQPHELRARPEPGDDVAADTP
jgi:hypothetical protein